MTAVSAEQWDLLDAAARDALTFTGGEFCRDGVELPAWLSHQARELVFSGLLAKNGAAVTVTADGRALLRGAR